MKTESTKVINVIIADDHALYKAAVKNALSFKKDIKVIADAHNGSHLLELLKSVRPDVILLDIQMPIMDGIATLPEIKKLHPAIKVIMLTMMNNQNMVRKLMDLGANGYLLKTSDSEMIYNAIKTCYEKEFYFNSLNNSLQPENLPQKISPSIKPGPADAILSEKEITILRLMCEEKSSREIAEAVGLSLRSIEIMRNILKIKTGAKSTAGLIMFAVKNKLLDLEK